MLSARATDQLACEQCDGVVERPRSEVSTCCLDGTWPFLPQVHPLRGYSLNLNLSWNVNGGVWMEEGLKGLSFCDATKTSMPNLYY